VRPARLALAFILGLVGVGWLGQGLGLIGGSFMTGSALWALIGAALLVAAILLIVLERRRSRATIDVESVDDTRGPSA
jgi:hypothetical protein